MMLGAQRAAAAGGLAETAAHLGRVSGACQV